MHIIIKAHDLVSFTDYLICIDHIMQAFSFFATRHMSHIKAWLFGASCAGSCCAVVPWTGVWPWIRWMVHDLGPLWIRCRDLSAFLKWLWSGRTAADAPMQKNKKLPEHFHSQDLNSRNACLQCVHFLLLYNKNIEKM